MVTTPQQDAPPGDEIDFGRLLALLWAGKWLIALCCLVALSVGIYSYMGAQRIYSADALLQLEEQSSRLALPDSLSQLAGDDPRTVTEIEILSSRMILGQVVAERNLDWSVEGRRAPLIGDILVNYRLPIPDHDVLTPYVRAGDSAGLSFLQVPPRWLGQPIALTVVDADRFTLDLPDGQRIDGRTGQPIIDEATGLNIEIGSLDAAPGRVFDIRQRTEASAISRVRRNLTISEKGRGSGILQMVFTWPDRREGQDILTTVSDVYVRQNIDRSAAEADSSLDFIDAQIPEALDRVRRAETALNDYREAQQSVDLDFETQNLLTQTTGIERQLRELQTQEDELAERYTQNHPLYKQLLAERARLQARLAELRSDVGALPETQREVINLSRDLQLAQQIYTQLLTRAQEIQVLRASTIGNVRVLDSAKSKIGPVEPNRNLILLLSLILGTLGGLGLVILRGWLRRGVQTAQEIEAEGIPIFATVNHTAKEAKVRRGQQTLPVLARTDPTDITVEAIRSLRTSLHFGMLDAATSSLAIVSTAPAAGKSFIATNLAHVAAEAGQRVCLIDADMRRGHLRKYFKLKKNGPGLADYLGGTLTLDEVLSETGFDTLSVIASGRYPPNPAELLMRPAFKDLIAALNDRFDLIVMDCPPVLAVTDPVIIAHQAGMVIGVARHNETPLGELVAMKKTLETSGAVLSGVVLNGFDPRFAPTGAYSYNYRYDYKTIE